MEVSGVLCIYSFKNIAHKYFAITDSVYILFLALWTKIQLVTGLCMPLI